jgi:hypothetical protein
MWRYLAGAVAALLMVAAGVQIYKARARPDATLPAHASPLAAPPAEQAAATPLPDSVPEASDRTREEKRFDRYDKDRGGEVTRDEYLAARHKAFAKLDTNGDGRLSFEEWAIKAETKFATADRDHSGAMNRVEFATTAVKRKPARRTGCPPTASRPAAADEEG